MASNEDIVITLYSSSISNASARLRIALSLKNLSYQLVTINQSRGEQHRSEFKALNPSVTIPLLVVTSHRTGKSIKIGQSIAALEYLDEAFPSAQMLMPTNHTLARAHIRTLVNILAADTHPILTRRVTNAISERWPGARVPDDENLAWYRYWLSEGLLKFEACLENADEKLRPGKFCVRNEITLADVVLMPELWMAKRIGVDLSGLENARRVFENMNAIEGVKKEEQQEEEA